VCLAACGGGGDPSGSSAVGSLTVQGCVIAEGGSSCEATIGWTTAGASSPRVLMGDSTLATAPSGSVRAAVGPAFQAVTLFDGTAKLDEDTVRGRCASASAWDGGSCRAYARRLDERAPTPFLEGGRPVSLEVVVFEPLTAGPFPTVVFHHGSTGQGNDPSLFGLTYTSEVAALFFAQRGFATAFPQRRGRGKSDGLYDEGFTPNRSGYSCVLETALGGFEHALADVDVAVEYVRGRETVDRSRLLSGGISRGGVLAVAHAGTRPGLFRGAVNFVGGWLGEGCADAVPVNRAAFVRGAAFPRPTLWLYGENDSFYSLPHSRGNLAAFQAAGGQAAFFAYARAAGLNGHFIIDDPALWSADLEAYLRQAGP
jgi:dienelactone hydrolase